MDLWTEYRYPRFYILAAIIATVIWLKEFLSIQSDQKFEVVYLSADEYYRTFKVFKENLNERGPSLLVKALESHQFQTTSLKVGNLLSLQYYVFFKTYCI